MDTNKAICVAFDGSMVTDINTNPCCRITDLDMVVSSRRGPDVTISLGGITGHSDLHDMVAP